MKFEPMEQHPNIYKLKAS